MPNFTPKTLGKRKLKKYSMGGGGPQEVRKTGGGWGNVTHINASAEKQG